MSVQTALANVLAEARLELADLCFEQRWCPGAPAMDTSVSHVDTDVDHSKPSPSGPASTDAFQPGTELAMLLSQLGATEVLVDHTAKPSPPLVVAGIHDLTYRLGDLGASEAAYGGPARRTAGAMVNPEHRDPVMARSRGPRIQWASYSGPPSQLLHVALSRPFAFAALIPRFLARPFGTITTLEGLTVQVTAAAVSQADELSVDGERSRIAAEHLRRLVVALGGAAVDPALDTAAPADVHVRIATAALAKQRRDNPSGLASGGTDMVVASGDLADAAAYRACVSAAVGADEAVSLANAAIAVHLLSPRLHQHHRGRLDGHSFKGIFVVYQLARCQQLVTKCEAAGLKRMAVDEVDWTVLDQHLEWAILLRLARFEDTLLHSVVVTTTNGKVSITAHCHHVAGYLVRLSALVSKYYSQTKVLLASATREPQSAARASARMQLLSAVIEVLRAGLYCLGVAPPPHDWRM